VEMLQKSNDRSADPPRVLFVRWTPGVALPPHPTPRHKGYTASAIPRALAKGNRPALLVNLSPHCVHRGDVILQSKQGAGEGLPSRRVSPTRAAFFGTPLTT
jgi:hypothetical protein